MTIDRAIRMLKMAVPMKAVTMAEFNDFIEAVNMAIDALEKLPSAEPEIIRCKDCRHGVDYYHEGDCYCSNPKWGLMYFGGSWEIFIAPMQNGRRGSEEPE